jgi:Na+/H+-translocating membrane pyrophosphatase
MVVARNRRGMAAFSAVVGALMWSLGFAVWAYVGAARTECAASASGETCHATHFAEGFGLEMLAVVAPAIVCLVGWVLLRRYCTRGEPSTRRAAIVLAMAFAGFCLLAAASVGLLLIPAAALLGLAVSATEPPPPATPGPRSLH